MTQRELGDRAQRVRSRDATRRIAGKIHDQRASPRTDQGSEPSNIHRAPCVERVANGNRPSESHDRRVDREAGVRHEDLITRVEHGEQGVEHHGLCARNDDDVLRRSSSDATQGSDAAIASRKAGKPAGFT